MIRAVRTILGTVILVATASPVNAVVFPGPFMVYFDSKSADLSEEIKTVLRNVPKVYESSMTGDMVRIVGASDPSERQIYGDSLSIRRAENVRRYLEALGISADEIVVRTCREHCDLIIEKEGHHAAANRRVEVSITNTTEE